MEATVARDGTFVFAATPAGKYVLTGYRRRPPLTDVTLAGGTPSVAWDDVIMNDDEDMWAEMPLGIGDGDIDNLVVTLTPGTPLTGRVAIEDDASAGPRRRQVRIALTTDARHSFDDRFVAVRPDGSISMRIRPGAYRILCSGDEEGRTFKTAIVNGQDIGDGPLIVGGEPLRDVQFVFGRFDTVLQGSIVEADGTASPDATVVAIPAERDKWFRLEESGHAKVARTTSGAYRIASLPPGEYYVVALHQFLGPPSAPVAAALTRIATRVTIRSGEPATVGLVARDRE
jgi:hypothetical protein